MPPDLTWPGWTTGRAGERGGGVLRHGEGGDVVPVQREEPRHMRRRGQVLLLGLLPPHPEGEPVLRQEDAGPVLRPAPAVMLMMRPRAQCGYV
uniref:Uncharacterized protein n=1 Tax=Zea mays TaxID=4577 RepID=C0PHL1_MAIZE|nr:unknown [Zea mays]